ncbi:hypothetical protein RB195_023530 [Necator americanus]|uniref:Reverse transcriptase domain-containing protein n=1 Tax=Necator americanus TaxID=51031 RepID=A0ABR1EJK5_NECAM
MPLCFTFIVLKKAFDTVEIEAVPEALDNQGVPTLQRYFNDIIIDVKRGVHRGDKISLKIFSATLENAMRGLEWDDMGVKVDGGTRMLAEFDETCRKIGFQLNQDKKSFMRDGWVSESPFTLNGRNISECSSYVYLGREINMMNDLTSELDRRKRAA